MINLKKKIQLKRNKKTNEMHNVRKFSIYYGCCRSDTNMETQELANKILEDKYYNFKIRQEQLQVIDSVIQAKDTIAVFPTGFGKSICYILPPLILDKV